MQAMSIAASGIQAAFSRADASAARTARFGRGADDVDLAAEAVERIGAVAELRAHAAVLRTADQMLGAVLDLRA